MNKDAQFAYDKLIKQQGLSFDSDQSLAVEQFILLEQRLENVNNSRFGFLSRIFSASPKNPKGLYLYGGVGRGKTMLMDYFYQSIAEKHLANRVHFHAFMHEIHQKLQQYRDQNSHDPLSEVAQEIAQNSKVLFFDEFFVTNITDAMILGRLFSLLFQQGICVVATSNIAIEDLYANGLQRAQFLPFIKLFHEKMHQHCLDSNIDYRQRSLQNLKRYFEDEAFDHAHETLIAHIPQSELKLHIYDRELCFSNHHRGILRTSFHNLCVQNLGTADYIQIAQNCPIVFLEKVPSLSGSDNDSFARRFLHLIDCLYEQQCQLFMELSVPLDQLYLSGRLNFEFQRCLSRLNEMQSTNYARQTMPEYSKQKRA